MTAPKNTQAQFPFRVSLLNCEQKLIASIALKLTDFQQIEIATNSYFLQFLLNAIRDIGLFV